MVDETREEAHRRERENHAHGSFTCQVCAGSDLPGYLDQTDEDTQGIHDWVPCPKCNPSHPLHSRSSMLTIGHSPAVVPHAVPMPAAFKEAMAKLLRRPR